MFKTLIYLVLKKFYCLAYEIEGPRSLLVCLIIKLQIKQKDLLDLHGTSFIVFSIQIDQI